jgi:MFS family permease
MKKSFVIPLILLLIGCAVSLGGFWVNAHKYDPSFWENTALLSVWVACELSLVAAAVATLAAEVLSSKRQRGALLAGWGVSVVAFAALSGTLLKCLHPSVFIVCGALIVVAFVFLLLIKVAKTARTKTLIALALCSFLVELATALLRLTDFRVGVPVGCGVYFCFTLLCLVRLKSKLKAWQGFLAILLGNLVLVAYRVYDFENTLASLPDAIFRVVGIIAGFAFFSIRGRLLRWLVLAVVVALCLFWYFKGAAVVSGCMP